MTDTQTTPAPDEAPEVFVPPNRDPRWAVLAAPFPADEIEKLPKQLSKDDRERYQCRQGVGGTRDGRPFGPSADGFYCGGYHARSIHLDYVGHAGVTTRLNAVDPTWTWEPMYRDVPNEILLAAISTGNENIVQQVISNAPMMFTQGGLWIRLTVLGVTRPGFGDASGKNGPDAVKEVIGDAIRNAGMRFGIATYLWSKSAKARAVHPDADADMHTLHAPPARPGTPLGERVDRQRDELAARRSGEFDHRSPEGRKEIARSTAAVAVNGHAAGQLPPPADDEPVHVAGARAVERARAQRVQNRPAQQPRREPERPAPRPAPSGDPEVAALVEAIVRASSADHVARLWAESASVRPQGRSTDIRGYLEHAVDDVSTAARLLGPIFAEIKVDPTVAIPVGALVVAIGKHLERCDCAMSLHDHVAADSAEIGPDGRAVTPPADAVPAH